MDAVCHFPDDQTTCARMSPDMLAAKYDGRVPRYTSYPTAPQFHAGIGAAEYQTWLAQIDPDLPISLYVHIPFCQQLCWYCGCNTRVSRLRPPIAAYVETLLTEIALVSAAIGFCPLVNALHFGGGTPNSLSPEDLDRIFAALHSGFVFTADAEIAAELDPRVLTPEWIDAAARNGINRASLGVQDIDANVQAAINRTQPWAKTVDAVAGLRAAGITSINLDLMYGLPYQTSDTIAETIEKVVSIAPDRIALFGYAHVPWMKPAQKHIPDATLPDTQARYAQQEHAAAGLARAGYIRVGLDHFVRIDDPLAHALAAGDVRRNFQGYTTDTAETLLGLGASSIGRLHDGYAQNHADLPTWNQAISEGRLPIARGVAMTDDDRLRGAIIEQLMCRFAVDLDAFADWPGYPEDRFAPELARLAPHLADALVHCDDRHLTVTDTGRPFVRSICAAFDRYLDTSGQRHSRGV